MPLIKALPTSKTALVVMGLFVLGILGYFTLTQLKAAECRRSYAFIDASVVCGRPHVIEKTNYNKARASIVNLINQEYAAGNVEEVAIYFRDLVNGPIFGINETMKFTPASLLKLPVAITFMNSAETQPEVLDYKIKYEGITSVGGQIFKPKKSAEPNVDYAIEDLLQRMLSYSDNASYEVLLNFLGKSPQRQELLYKTYQELGFVDPSDRLESTVTVSGYASLFRILYTSAYLNAEGSAKILRWLTESDFDEGLRAGVPVNIPIAHKFGERIIGDQQMQIHDCGIVYYPRNPYTICVMTRGKDYGDLLAVIRKISAAIYEEVNSRKL